MTEFSFESPVYLRHLDIEINAEITCNYIAPERGRRGPHGEPLEPDYDSEIEIVAIRDGDSLYDFDDLDRSEQDYLIEEAWEQIYVMQEERE